MTKLLPSVTRGRPVPATRLRAAWLAIWLQARRRARQVVSPTPNAPVITSGVANYGTTSGGYWDVLINWTFSHGGLPVATIEVWESQAGGAYALLASPASAAVSYNQGSATDLATYFELQVRYRNAAILGPFSNVYRVTVEP